MLELVGLIPAFGEAADLINAAIYLGEGKTQDALFAAAGALPGPGNFIGGARVARKVAGVVGIGGTAAAGAKLAKRGAGLADEGIDAARRAGNLAADAPRRGGIGPVLAGRAGEQAVGITKPKPRITINGRNRFPDAVDPDARLVTEVKNVKRLSYTQQLRDYAHYARLEGYTFELWVPAATARSGLSRPLREAIENGDIRLRIIPGM